MEAASFDHESVLADLISLWRRSRAEGESVTSADLCRDRPELLPALECQIAALQQLDALTQDLHETPTVPPQNGERQANTDAATIDPNATVPPNLQEPTSSPSAAVPDAPSVPGYEVLSILGKGGMGIVYKARQVKLDRLVALKMMLYSYAGDHKRLRFQVEAEAVARLRHPHIVQIYEVGDYQGSPYFSLEFCAGGSLADQLDSTPWEAKKAARLVETLARAMQAAHQAQVIHRDLKPENVLLTEEGVPKVTDFGRAKKLDVQGQTQTGQIMGTPSYMAPEQAGGSKDIGPAADVYALGAILYELLTGRPPFKAATALDTIMQVVSEEPVPVRQMQPQMPRDIETICHKCLQKEPKKRYGNALALAEDLHRFVAGEPVAARPVSLLERGWRWCRRNPVVASLTALVACVLLASSLISWGLAAWALGEKDRADDQAEKRLQQKNRADKQAEIAKGKAEEALQQKRRADEQTKLAKGKAEEALQEKRQAVEALDLAERRLYASRLAQAQRAWQDNDARSAKQLLKESNKIIATWNTGCCGHNLTATSAHSVGISALSRACVSAPMANESSAAATT